ncbi:lycopene cyclase family protein [Streptomyces sp. NPDC051219]|uniref:lycopene cyclase family protein n=1 Tax=Streptomyces sp. NPDC051219 TaxID=3155283 RepID=UPI0034226D5F
MWDADVVIVGAGASGLSLAYRLAAPAPRHGQGALMSVALVDAPAGPLRPAERTWCFWEEPGGEYDRALAGSWHRLRITGADGEAVVGRPAPLRYKMIRSGAFEAMVDERLGRSSCVRHEATVESVHDRPGGAEVRGRDANGREVRLRARWVFDSRPPRRLPPARTTLLQHFRGWFVRTEQPVFEVGVADLMDFRTPQPGHGLSFGYVLPLGPREALVEYTEFSRTVLDDEAYDRALRHYTADVLGLGPGLGRGNLTVTATEQGVIPMTDARFPHRAGRSVFLIGAAGGATRPSTGYTFSAVQRHTRAIADALLSGRPPRVRPPHPLRARTLDAVFLRALDTGRVSGAAFFAKLFREVPTERLLRFLDGCTGWHEDFLIGLHTPVRPMLRTVAELPWVSRRPPAG